MGNLNGISYLGEVPFSIGVIGLGRMAQAILAPLMEKGVFNPKEIIGVVGKKKSVNSALSHLPKGLVVVSSEDSSADEVWNSPIKLLAVKPQQLGLIKEKTLKKDNFSPTNKPLLISLLAGVRLEKLQTAFPSHNCVRAVPNTPALVKAGLTGLSWGEGVSDAQRFSAEAIFKPISQTFELPEEQLDSFLALTSSGPAYIAMISEALADGAVASGLPRDLAYNLANLTLLGSAKLLIEKNLHPAQLKDMVSSPAGTTITALRHLEMAGIRSALMEAVVLAAQRSRELA
ncbi:MULTISPECIES: pyrroline-5-carboxylate reductase [Prochlorococcus]|uniref:pyrroline-5-carboxylate reductase n=1 Tax=Prochlorococcus TaxID=1218 RepID=UPI0005338F45|nr:MULTISPECIES: pyrroline-5-carboxylate reductase [Prochlorococcus]KGG13003.1 Pyrroline-5-carboxylate reductase [Prochlorococcus sp. MIT 0601]